MLKLLLVVSFLSAFNTLTDQEVDNKNKLIACIKLVKAALHYDKEFLPNTVKRIRAKEGIKDLKELEEKFFEVTLLTCYNSLPLIKSAEFIKKPGFEGINPKRSENNVYINYSSYNEKYFNNARKFEKDNNKLQETINTAQEEVTSLRTMLGNAFKEQLNEFKEKNSEFNQQGQSNYYQEEEKMSGYDFGMPHVGFLKTMDPRLRVGLGLGLIALLFLILLLGYKRLSSPNISTKKKKNK